MDMETATESTRHVVMILLHLKKKNVDPNASGSYRSTHNLPTNASEIL